MAEQSKTYCILPFVHSHASVSGHWKPCCNSIVSENSTQSNLYNDKGFTHKTWFESSRMDLLRKNLSNGVRDPMCSICWKSEDVSGTSMRIRYNDTTEGTKFHHILKEQRVTDKLTRKKDKELKIKYLDLKIGNECNLKCRMCDYTNSSKLLEDIVAIENDKSLELPIEWHRSPRHEAVMDEKGIKSMPERVVREIIDDILPSLRILKVTGGEPMVQHQVLELFKVCVDKGYAKNILILDLDVHQGNGNSEIFQNDKNVLTFSMHCASNYPAKKSKSDIDVELADNMEDNEYLNILNENLKKLNQSKYDFVFYIAGVDIHHNDRLGKLKITDEGINKRDQIVIENFYSKNIPLCGVLGGGYNNSFDKLIELHSMLHKNCAEYF